MSKALLDAALRLADLGVHVFPCKARSKEPATIRGLCAATVDPDRIKRLWAIDENFNVGAVTGAVSGFFALDIDSMAGENAVAALEAEHGALPATIENVTASGRHVLFQWDPNYEIRNSVSKIAPSVDVRGQQGYILMPPSWHPSGRQYARSVDCAGVLAAAPEWLLRLAGTPTTGARKAVPTEQWCDLIASETVEGERNSTAARLAGHLLRHNVSPSAVLELLCCWNAARCMPPLPDDEIAQVVDSICRKEASRRETRSGPIRKR
jgi:Bifunctional DNA primase/polymerase, N-terminal/Primase C terminal 1 (PriCT-1)